MRLSLKRFILCVTVALISELAYAHAKPKVMVPDANSTVSSPAQISIFFTEALEPKFSSVKLVDEKSAIVSRDSKVDPADHRHIMLDLPKLAPGVYHVHWITAATDGHRMDGEYSFTVK